MTKASQPEKNPLEPGWSPTPSGHPNAPAEHLPFPVVIVSTRVFLSFSLEYFDVSHIPVPTLASILLGIQAKWVLPKWENSAEVGESQILPKWENHRLTLLYYVRQHSEEQTNDE